MSNPVVVEALRGERIESLHMGAGAVVDGAGRVVFAFGDVERPIYPRSAVKALQALPLVESGAADRLRLGEEEIALACASHAGEMKHVATAAAMLAKAGLGERALACGVHWPISEAAARALARNGEAPSQLHNNCSGKHAGFLCLSCAQSIDPEGYFEPDHPAQRQVAAALSETMGVRLGEENRGVDGCSVPTYAVPLSALAHGFARFATGVGLPASRARAAARIRKAVAAHPDLVGGAGRFDTELMTILGERAFIKSGAEGVLCAALPEQGLGLAVKADDGAARAAHVMAAALLARFGEFDASLELFVAPPLRNWKGVEVGALKPAGPLA